jgi:adenosylmethionine-8-amino-7-oxononanoate aminotransferase
LNEALIKQVRELEHVMFAGCTHRPAVELAEELLKVVPAGLTRVFYSDNGSTAVEVAMKMAVQYWGNRGEPRKKFVALEHAYHGDTVGSMSVSSRSVFTAAFDGLMFEVGHVRDLGAMEVVLRSGDIAAVIIEPMLQGAGGMRMWPAKFVCGVRELCSRMGVLMIADEVLTGFGRTGKMFACEHAGVTPDLMCLSKGITGGYMALGATLATEAIYEAFLSEDRAKTFFHGHSFTANPLACAVALASLRLFQEEPVMERVQRIERQMRRGLESLRGLSHVADVRVLGGVGAVELRSDSGGYLDRMGPKLSAEFLKRRLLLRPLGNVVYFMPPYVVTETECEWVLDEMRIVLSGKLR